MCVAWVTSNGPPSGSCVASAMYGPNFRLWGTGWLFERFGEIVDVRILPTNDHSGPLCLARRLTMGLTSVTISLTYCKGGS